MIDNIQLVFAILGLIGVVFIVLELLLDIDTFAGRFISKVKKSKSKEREED